MLYTHCHDTLPDATFTFRGGWFGYIFLSTFAKAWHLFGATVSFLLPRSFLLCKIIGKLWARPFLGRIVALLIIRWLVGVLSIHNIHNSTGAPLVPSFTTTSTFQPAERLRGP